MDASQISGRDTSLDNSAILRKNVHVIMEVRYGQGSVSKG